MSNRVLVPNEPTEQMKKAPHPNASHTDAYKDMIDAALSCGDGNDAGINHTMRQLYDTIERMERNAAAHEDSGEVNTAIQLRHWAQQFHETLDQTKGEWTVFINKEV